MYHPFTSTSCQGKADVVFEVRERNLDEKQGFVHYCREVCRLPKHNSLHLKKNHKSCPKHNLEYLKLLQLLLTKNTSNMAVQDNRRGFKHLKHRGQL